MSISINYKYISNNKNNSNDILFVDEKFNVLNIKKHISSSEYSFISDLIKTTNVKKKIVTFDINSKKKNITNINIKKNHKFRHRKFRSQIL